MVVPRSHAALCNDNLGFSLTTVGAKEPGRPGSTSWTRAGEANQEAQNIKQGKDLAQEILFHTQNCGSGYVKMYKT